MKDARALGKFILAVPRADDVLHARVECALCQSDEKPENIKRSCRFRATLGKCKDGPDELRRMLKWDSCKNSRLTDFHSWYP